MSCYVCGSCFKLRGWSSLVMAVRGMKSVNTRMIKPMHITKAKLMEVTRFQERKDLKLMAEKCSMRHKRDFIKTPKAVQTFMADQCRQYICGRQLIAVYHNEGLSNEEVASLKRRLKKVDVTLKMYSNDIMREVVTGTALDNLRPLLVGRNMYAISDDPSVKKLLKITKKIPKIHLLGGLVENQLMSGTQMVQFSKLPDKGTLQGQLAGLLTQTVSSTYNLLQQNQQLLVASLDQMIKQKEQTNV